MNTTSCPNSLFLLLALISITGMSPFDSFILVAGWEEGGFGSGVQTVISNAQRLIITILDFTQRAASNDFDSLPSTFSDWHGKTLCYTDLLLIYYPNLREAMLEALSIKQLYLPPTPSHISVPWIEDWQAGGRVRPGALDG